MSDARNADIGSDAEKPKQPAKLRIGFLGAGALLIGLLAFGQLVGNRFLSSYSPWLAVRAALLDDWAGARALLDVSGWHFKDWATTVFLMACVAYVIVWRELITRFFRSMQVGVTVIALTALAVLTGVLVPQIENFEDPVERVTEANYDQNYQQFRWAEGYFLYHLSHPYGIGMPSMPIPDQALQSLDRYERIYGKEERHNRETLMKSAFSGQPKTAAIEALIEDWDPWLRRAFDTCTFLELNRTYKSNWFATLLWLLATSIVFNTFRVSPRKWFTVEKLGFFVTHVGMLTLLAGGLWSNLLTDRGILQLNLDKPPNDTYWQHYRPDKLRQMPFSVRLDHFARKEWKALEVHFLAENFKSKPPRYTLWPGRTIDLDYELVGDEWKPRTRLRVLELYDHARIDAPKVWEGDAKTDDPVPVVELEVPNVARGDEDNARVTPEGPTRSLYLSPLLPDQGYIAPDRSFRMVVAHDQDPAKLFPPDPDRTLGTLYVEVHGAGGESLPHPIAVRIGEQAQLPGGYQVDVVDATSDFQIGRNQADALAGSGDQRPMAERPDRFCAVWIDIRGPNDAKPERRIVHEMIDAVEYGLQDRYPHKEVVCELRWDRWSAPGGPRYVLAWNGGEHAEATLIDEQGTQRPVEIGQRLPLPGDTVVKPLRFFEHARFEKRLRFLPNEIRPDGWDASFYSHDARGLVVEVVHFPGTDREVTERVEMASTDTDQSNVWMSGDQRFALRFVENTEGFPFDWRSVLSIIERDASGQEHVVDLGSEKAREIRVNEYFRYKGYRFFQTNADPELPLYSGIGVVYDPGIPMVLAGMYTIIVGTLIAFIVRPIVRFMREERSAAA